MSISSELRAELNPESLQKWESVKAITTPGRGKLSDQSIALLEERLNLFIADFKSTSWISNPAACRKLDQDIKELTKLLNGRKNELQEKQDIDLFKQDLYFCVESRKRANEVKIIVDQLASRPNAISELNQLSGDLTKLIKKIDKEIILDQSQIKRGITERLQEAITLAYTYGTKEHPHLLADSLGSLLGKYSSDNRALAKALKPSFQSLTSTDFFNRTQEAIEIMERGFTQDFHDVPSKLADRLNKLKSDLVTEFPKQEQARLLRQTIEDSYQHYSRNHTTRILEFSLGKFLGGNSTDNTTLRGIQHENLEQLPDEKLADLTRQAVALIRKGFKQLDEPMPKKLISQLLLLSKYPQ